MPLQQVPLSYNLNIGMCEGLHLQFDYGDKINHGNIDVTCRPAAPSNNEMNQLRLKYILNKAYFIKYINILFFFFLLLFFFFFGGGGGGIFFRA